MLRAMTHTASIAAALLAVAATPALAMPADLPVISPATAPAPPAADAPAPGASALPHSAEILPPDVDFLLQIDDGAILRKQLENRPLTTSLQGLLTDERMIAAWSALSAQMKMEPLDLFDRYLGSSSTLAVRGSGFSAQWVLVLHIDEADHRLLRERMEPQVVAAGLQKLLEQNVVMTYVRPRLIIGPQEPDGLFKDVVKRAEGVIEGGSLAEDPKLRDASTIRPGSITFFTRHAPPMGGWSLLTASLTGERLLVNHTGTYDQAPVPPRSRPLEFDAGVLENLKKCSLMAVLEPVDEGGGDAFWAALLPELMLDRDARTNLKDRTILMVGQEEGRMAEKPFDMLYPTFAFAVEVKDPVAAAADQDDLVEGAVRGANRRYGELGRFMLAVPDGAKLEQSAVRRIDLSQLAKALVGDHPFADTVSLNYTVVTAGTTSWQVYATDADFLNQVVDALKRDPPAGARRGDWASAGFASARRLGSHLDSWRAQVNSFFDPADVETVRDFLESVCRLAEGVDHVEWRLDQPAVNRLRTEVSLELAPPVTR